MAGRIQQTRGFFTSAWRAEDARRRVGFWPKVVSQNTYTKNEARARQTVPMGALRVCDAEVEAAGARRLDAGRQGWSGRFQDVRIFEEAEGVWRCRAWLNKKVG